MADGFTRTLTPAWIVYVDGRRLDPEHEGLLKAIRVENNLNKISTCTLSFSDDISSKGILTLLSSVSVHIGYKDDIQVVFYGDITARHYSFNDRGEKYEVLCSNVLQRMNHGMQCNAFEHKTPAAIIRETIERYGLQAEVEEFGPEYEFTAQRYCSAYEYIQSLSKTYGKEIYAWGNTVYVQDEITIKDDQIVYEKGKTLISCYAENSLICEKGAFFIDTDIRNGDDIKGGSANPEKGKYKHYIVSYCVDNEDAENKAYGYLKNILKKYRRADIKVGGDYRLQPGMRVELKYVDNNTDGEYITEQVRHEIDKRGYVTYAELYKPITPTGKPRDRVNKKTKKEEKQQPEEQKEKAAVAEDLSKSIHNPVWKKNGKQISKALVGDEVTLCADTHNIADGTAATIKIVEKDADGNDDDVTILSAKVQNNKIECAWKVVYTADDDDADSEQEKKEKGYTLPEYAFTVECDGEKSAESGQLDVRGWIKTKFTDKRTGKPLANKKYTVYLLDGSTIKGSTDENGFVDLKELKYGEYFIIFKD